MRLVTPVSAAASLSFFLVTTVLAAASSSVSGSFTLVWSSATRGHDLPAPTVGKVMGELRQ